MLVIPAIDIKDGKVVRLYRGEFDKVKIYSKDPVSVAGQWESQGGKLLHVVDLDGAAGGALKNLGTIKKIAKAVSIPIQVGGGIRTLQAINEALSAGAHRVVMGTRACEDDVFIHRIISEFGERIVVSIDAKDQMVATEGWKKVSDVNVVDFIKKLEFFGLKVMIYTDIAKDGTLEGPNIKAVKEILSARESIMVISSGGVSTVEDLARLKELEPQGLLGVIVGKALYEKKINLKEAIERC